MKVNYLDDLQCQFSDDMSQDLRDLFNSDIQFLKGLGVKNDRERNLAFYLDSFCDDLCEEFGYKIEDKKPIIVKSFNLLRNLKNVDLTKIRAAVLKSLRELNVKVAYPNTTGVSEQNIKPVRNIDQWVQALGEIYKAMHNGEDRHSAVQRITKEWDSMSKRDFEVWARYYEKGDHEKYNIKTAAEIPTSFMFDKDMQHTEKEEVVRKPKPKAKNPDEMKRALISRLNAAEKLLYSFVHVWPNEVYNRLHQGLSDLKREISMMRTASSMVDRIIRTASLWENQGFNEGAKELRKIAAPPGDITTEIEKALTGREFEKDDKPEEIPMPDMGAEMPGGEMPGGEMPGGEMPGGEMPPMPDDVGGPPAGVEESLPPVEEPTPPMDEEEPSDPSNPFGGASIQDVLDVLEPLSQKLREREFIRALSKADMMLDSLKIASHFPELGEAQAKALELNIYVNTRIERVISKLKGGVKEDSKEDTSAPDIDMDELGGKPPEEVAFEVSEKGEPPQKGEVPPPPPLEK
jgi:hypothetical protein